MFVVEKLKNLTQKNQNFNHKEGMTAILEKNGLQILARGDQFRSRHKPEDVWAFL